MLNAAEAEQPKLRRHGDGPLKLEEFRGKIASNLPGGALTMTRVMIEYKYGVQVVDDQIEARLSSIQVFSVFLPEESWWRAAHMNHLLDHEQGHFDIAEIAARRLQLAFNRAFADGKAVSGVGASQQEAVQAMAAKLVKLLRLVNEQAVDENKAYDRLTSHGARRRAQFEHRKIQTATLKRLAQQLQQPSHPPSQESKSGVTGRTLF